MFFLYLTSITNCATTPTSTCADAECASKIRSTEKFKRNDLMSIFANITTVNGSFYGQYYVTTDKLTLLQVPVSKCDTFSNTSYIRLQTGNYSTSKIPLIIFNDQRNLTVDFYSVVVFVDEGQIKGISWDTSLDAQETCQYGHAEKQCLTIFDNQNECAKHIPLRVYLAFSGTDKDKVHMTSAQYLPSTFKKFGVRGIYTDATKFISGLKDKISGWVDTAMDYIPI